MTGFVRAPLGAMPFGRALEALVVLLLIIPADSAVPRDVARPHTGVTPLPVWESPVLADHAGAARGGFVCTVFIRVEVDDLDALPARAGRKVAAAEWVPVAGDGGNPEDDPVEKFQSTAQE